MNNELDIFLSKKVLRILELFEGEEKVIPFSKVMQVGKFKNPMACWDYMTRLINSGAIRCIFSKSTYIKY